MTPNGVAIGAIDLGGTKVALGLADADGRLVATSAFPTRPERGPEAVVAEMAEGLRALAGDARLARVGVGSVGPLDLDTGTILSPPNFPGWDRVPLRAMLEAALGVPVAVDNDANVAALGEYHHGAGRGADVLVYVTVSTGVGGGLVVGGRLLHGLGGGAGELGHQTVRPDGPPCGCGNRGCLEALASGTAIVARARAAGHADVRHAGDVLTRAPGVWDAAMDDLALGLGNVVSILAPDRLVLGGGVTKVGQPLLDALRPRLAARVKLVPTDRLDLRLAELGDGVGLVGAAMLRRD